MVLFSFDFNTGSAARYYRREFEVFFGINGIMAWARLAPIRSK